MQRDSVEEALARIEVSKPFALSLRMRRFLRFAVERALTGDRDALKEYTIGVEVFDRSAEYDPRIDSIVRVEARRLRKKLAQYYAGEGAGEPLRVSLPEGSYVPVIQPRDAPVPVEQPIVALTGGTALLVLPFAASPAAGEAEFFADGLTEELINELSQVRGLRVVARSTAFQHKGRNTDGRRLGVELGVSHIVEGSVRVMGGQLRATAQLIRVSDGLSEWSEGFGGSLNEAFNVQQQIARAITRVLGAQLAGAPADAAHVISGDAYQHLLEGRYFAGRMTPANLKRSIECFQRAIQMDPRFAAAYAALAGSVLMLALFGRVAPSMVIPEAGLGLYKALQYNPELPAGHMWRAYLKATYEWNWDEAEVDFQRALELNTGLVPARVYYASTVMAPLGRFDEALAHLNAARLLDPASVVLRTAMGMVHYLQNDLHCAVDELRQAMALNSEYYGAHRFLAFAMHRQGETDAAIHVLDGVRQLAVDDPRILAALGYLQGLAGRTGAARTVLREFDTLSANAYVASFDRALVHLGLGELDTACRLLTVACTEHEPWLTLVRVDPVFAPLHGMAAFESLVERIFHLGD
jgi:TolB-like protein/Flp pilus assembly protein TadD